MSEFLRIFRAAPLVLRVIFAGLWLGGLVASLVFGVAFYAGVLVGGLIAVCWLAMDPTR